MQPPAGRFVMVKIGAVWIPGKVIGEDESMLVVNPGAPGLRYLFAEKGPNVRELQEGEDGTILTIPLGVNAKEMGPTQRDIGLPPAVSSRLAYLGLQLEIDLQQGTLVLVLKKTRVGVTT